ncbi:hypothetical protein GCM10025867_07190 [Frondihabitans sucicola]|uniref:HTH-type transcriptional regulator MT1864/Rv1816-like C-terminal domain-containing protein n=1 Tax=Frondihabitans sucicola TaxID=1268041 RepID=A0ABN6XU57_9MICO|nr:TetR-like C-terminal domain-containing protein [Frondihabitans sucicola]BDZ48478.1 hypothetical protein GCM10025867_07190 [Frondihabitans sucicola]
MAGEQDPAARLAAFAAAYVRFAVTDRALFEVTFRAGLDKADHPGLDDAGQDVLVILQDPARRLRPDDSSALELVYAVAASAHGFAMFLLEGVFPDGDDTLDRVEARARRSAASLAEAEAAADFLP